MIKKRYTTAMCRIRGRAHCLRKIKIRNKPLKLQKSKTKKGLSTIEYKKIIQNKPC